MSQRHDVELLRDGQAVSSARSARRFASGSMRHSCSIRLETMKLLSPRNPLAWITRAHQ